MRKSLLFSLFLFICVATYGQQNLWQQMDESWLSADRFPNGSKPKAYKVFQLKSSIMTEELKRAPSEKSVSASTSSFILSVPNAEGVIERYRVVNAPVMHPDLAAKYPGIHSYAGKGIDRPNSTIRFSMGMGKFEGMILSTDRPTIYIDQSDEKKQLYLVVSRNEIIDYKNEFKCFTDEKNTMQRLSEMPEAQNATDGKLRTFRLALASTGEFSQFWLNGTETTDAQRKAKVLVAMNAAMTRTNGIYERDFAIRMILVPNNDLVIYLDASTDPWSGELNSTTQVTIDAQIGDANYDIGHLVHRTSDNGNAGCIGCVCQTGEKGSGFTSYNNLNNFDWFVVDYLAHEMGHQFGGNHTHTHGGNEGTGVQVEPGSGSTIMGYAGITGPTTDVQPHSDDYFHAVNIQQITNYIINGAGSCAVITNTGNNAPTASAGADFTIPRSTPFVLTGSGSDIDAGDILSYNWEQVDSRASGFSTVPSATATAGPQFRSFLSTATPSRTIPQLATILTGANGQKWEVLPSVNRTLNFRLTVRDNKLNGGSTQSDNMVLTITNTSGPFLVTAPNTTGISWNSGSAQTVSWSVGNTTLAPVNCANVAIDLSTDGGLTFPITIVASTPNDGSEIISVPNNPTTQARIRVRAVGNIFFDINNANFTIVAADPGFDFNAPAAATVSCSSAASGTIQLAVTSILGYTTPADLSAIAGVPAGTTVSFSSTTVTPGNNVDITLNNTNTLAFGSYDITIQGVSGSITKTRVIRFIVQPGTGPSVITDPSSQTICAGSNITFSSAATGASSQVWQLSTDGGGTWNNIAGQTGTSYTVNGTTAVQNNYRYRCVYTGQCNTSNTSAAVLTVQIAPAVSTQPVSGTICAGSNRTFSVSASGSALNYQWEVSTDGGNTFNPIGSANANSYTVSAATITQNNYRYRCVVSGACTPAVTSNAATLNVFNAVAISNQPADITICSNSNTNFTVAATGSVVGYQWQESTDGGSSYNNIGGATNATLPLTAVTSGQTGYRYRCVITGGCSNATSNAAILTVQNAPAFTAQPTSNNICQGSGNTFSVTATGNVLSYQWQLSTDGGTNFTNINGADASSYAVTNATVAQNNYRYRCIVSGACTPAITSTVAVLNVTAPVVVNAQPSNAALCGSGNAGFSINATGTGISYQWQLSTNGGIEFNDVNSATAATLNVNATGTNFDNYKYRVILRNGVCTDVTSTVATLTVNPLPAVSLSPAPYSKLFPGLQTTITATVTPSTGVTLSWQKNGVGITNTGNTLTVNIDQLGDYKVTATGTGGCIGESNTLSIADSATNKIFFYPNPNGGQFQVRYYNPVNRGAKNYTRVFDGKGSKVYEQQFTVTRPYDQMMVDLRRRGTGIYLVQLTDASGKQLATGRVVIQ